MAEITTVCRFYEEIGAGLCDRCGRPAREHEGLRLLRKGAGPFSIGKNSWENLTWAEYEIRRSEEAQEAEARKKFDANPLAALAVINAARELSNFLENEKQTTDPAGLWAEGKDPGKECVACESLEDYDREEQLSEALVEAFKTWDEEIQNASEIS
jgi:hypothetical protein